jgi:hypothetical protein
MYSTQVDGGAHVVGFGSVRVDEASGRKLRSSFLPIDPVIGKKY